MTHQKYRDVRGALDNIFIDNIAEHLGRIGEDIAEHRVEMNDRFGKGPGFDPCFEFW